MQSVDTNKDINFGEQIKTELAKKELHKPDEHRVYVDYMGKIVKSPQPGYILADLSEVSGIPVGAINRFIRRGFLKLAYKEQGSISGHWLIPPNQSLTKFISRRQTYLNGSVYGRYATNQIGRSKRMRSEFKVVDGVKYKYCRACVMERGLSEAEAWHTATTDNWHMQGRGLYSICKACRANRKSNIKVLTSQELSNNIGVC